MRSSSSALAAVALCSTAGTTVALKPKLNVLFFAVDDLRYQLHEAGPGVIGVLFPPGACQLPASLAHTATAAPPSLYAGPGSERPSLSSC